MGKQKGMVSDKEKELRAEYQDYLRNKRWGGKEEYKKAKPYAVWKKDKLNPVKPPKRYGALSAVKTRRSARNKAYEEATGRKAK